MKLKTPKVLAFLGILSALLLADNCYAQVSIFTPCVNGLQVDVNGVYYGGKTSTNIVWNWGDGQQPTSIYFPENHFYASAGQYAISITVHYSDGTSASALQTVTVGPGILSGCYAWTIYAGQGGSVSYQGSVAFNCKLKCLTFRSRLSSRNNCWEKHVSRG